MRRLLCVTSGENEVISFNCPTCQSRCLVQDQCKGRKLRCPRCGSRVQHNTDGTVDLLSVGIRAPSDIVPPELQKYVEVGTDSKIMRAKPESEDETVEAFSVEEELPDAETSSGEPS